MIVIIKNLAACTMATHLQDLIRPQLSGGIFRKKGKMDSLTVCKHALVSVADIEYYALVNIEPDSVAKRVIQALDKQKLHGKQIEAAEFHERHWSHERRDFYGPPVKLTIDRREGERRRNQVDVDLSGDDSTG